MHSFHPSRGRVLFDALCALGMAAALAGAWMQTGASGLLAAAGAAALYGLVHLLDVTRPKPAEATEPQRIDFQPEAPAVFASMVAAGEQPVVDSLVEQGEAVETVAARTGAGRRSGGSRKGSGRRSKAGKAAKVAEPAPAEEADVPWPMAKEESPPERASSLEEEFPAVPKEEPAPPHIEPLFQPEPFVRMPRQAFGRRGQI